LGLVADSDDSDPSRLPRGDSGSAVSEVDGLVGTDVDATTRSLEQVGGWW
jgi:hypothetical protein